MLRKIRVNSLFYVIILLVEFAAPGVPPNEADKDISIDEWRQRLEQSKNKFSMKDVLTKIILDKKWNKNHWRSRLTESCNRVERFFRSLISDKNDYLNLLKLIDVNELTDAFNMIPERWRLPLTKPYSGLEQFLRHLTSDKNEYVKFLREAEFNEATDVLYMILDRIRSPLTKSYDNVEQFVRAVVPDLKLAEDFHFNNLSDLFYMIPYRKSESQNPPYDLNVLRVWLEDENFGDDMKIAVIGDGMLAAHPDLIENYDDKIERDYVKKIKDHAYSATRAAGLISMKLVDGSCGVGVAPKAKIGAIHLIDENEMDLENFASSLIYLYKEANVDIVLNTWIPTDATIEVSPHLQKVYDAYKETATKGRKGKGLIHVVPIGELSSDTVRHRLACSRNVNVNSIHTIAVAATNYDGSKIKNSADCSAVMVTAFSTDAKTHPDEYKMRTTDADGGCTDEFKNTNAAASLVAGVLALALKANPNLTYRDIHHLIAWTSEVSSIQRQDKFTWTRNKGGFYVSPFYGFGMINGYNLVQKAKIFKSVPRMNTCIQPVKLKDNSSKSVFRLTSDGCRKTPDAINYIEHIQIQVSIRNNHAEVTRVAITSPQGTETYPMRFNASKDGHIDETVEWMFDTIMYWGESPVGEWNILIDSKSYERDSWSNSAEVTHLTLYFYGTKEAPKHYYKKGYLGRTHREYMEPTPTNYS